MGGQICSEGRGFNVMLNVIKPEMDDPGFEPTAAFAAEILGGMASAERTWSALATSGDKGDLHAFEVAQMIAADRKMYEFKSASSIPASFEVKEPSMQDPPDTYVAVHRDTGTVRRLVTVRKPSGFEQQERLRTTVRKLQAVRSHSVSRIFEVFEDSRATSLVTEHCSGGTVYDRILQRQYFAEQETAMLIRHVLQSLACLHKNGTAHGHPTPDSFRFHTETPHASLKLVDYGLELKVNLSDALHAVEGLWGSRDRRRAACLPFFETCRLVFAAPEVVQPLRSRRSTDAHEDANSDSDHINQGGTDLDGDLLAEAIDAHLEHMEKLDLQRLEAADAWSVGAIAFLLLCGYPPFFAPCRYAILGRIEKTDYAFDPPFWSKISEEAKDFVQGLLRASPSDRMPVAQALRHPWILSLADTSPSGSMLSSFALNLRRFYRTSLIEAFAANSLAAKLSFEQLCEFHERCRCTDVARSGFFTATDLRQVLVKLGHDEIAEAIGMCLSKTLRHPGESYIDYLALVDSVRARRMRILEEELWSSFCAFADAGNAVRGSSGGSKPVETGFQAAALRGKLPISRLKAFLEVPQVHRSLTNDGIEDAALLVEAVRASALPSLVGGEDSAGQGVAFVEVDFIELASEVMRLLPPMAHEIGR
mmetsp:Transcript_105715/g.297315  ORF Transcript_105715/g.297315 Transcript_105715/m.297315 type:complete len:649 (-) Transcript_105715:64-2010(-)